VTEATDLIQARAAIAQAVTAGAGILICRVNRCSGREKRSGRSAPRRWTWAERITPIRADASPLVWTQSDSVLVASSRVPPQELRVPQW